jgi:curli biogenesis system outer membrane secretion channel CsgG
VRLRLAHVLMLAVAVALGSPALPAGGDEAWNPRLESDGETKDLGDPRQVKDKDWLTIRYGQYSGYRTRLGVLVSEGDHAYSPQYKKTLVKLIMDLSGKPETMSQPQYYIEDLVRQAMDGTHRFTLLERTTASKDIAAEQAAGASASSTAAPSSDGSLVQASAAAFAPGDSSRMDPSTVARPGRIIGAEYLVKATLIELNPEKDTKEIKAEGAGANGSSAAGLDLGVKKKASFCRLNVRVIRVESGEIVIDETIDGTATSTGLTGGLGFGLRMMGKAAKAVSGSAKKRVPISDAMQVCANKAAYQAAMKLGESIWQGTVASVTGKQVTIVGGTDVGLQEGMTLTLLARGADIVDPETSQVVGFETSEIGQIKIVTTQEKLSTCEIVQGGDRVKQGDLVRRESSKR